MPEILNQPFQVLKWWPQAIILCQCKKEHGITTILVLTGIQSRVLCEHCGKSYYIQGFTMTKDGPGMLVNFDLPAPERLM